MEEKIVLGSALREGDFVLTRRVETAPRRKRKIHRIFDTQTTTSGRAFVLAEAGGSLVTFPADESYRVEREEDVVDDNREFLDPDPGIDFSDETIAAQTLAEVRDDVSRWSAVEGIVTRFFHALNPRASISVFESDNGEEDWQASMAVEVSMPSGLSSGYGLCDPLSGNAWDQAMFLAEQVVEDMFDVYPNAAKAIVSAVANFVDPLTTPPTIGELSEADLS